MCTVQTPRSEASGTIPTIVLSSLQCTGWKTDWFSYNLGDTPWLKRDVSIDTSFDPYWFSIVNICKYRAMSLHRWKTYNYRYSVLPYSWIQPDAKTANNLLKWKYSRCVNSIVLGEVKVDLAIFDHKLQDNWLYTLFQYLFLQKHHVNLFLLHTEHQKITFRCLF